jgi:hypothetical protein
MPPSPLALRVLAIVPLWQHLGTGQPTLDGVAALLIAEVFVSQERVSLQVAPELAMEPSVVSGQEPC